jgi:uncharacterized membrane protein
MTKEKVSKKTSRTQHNAKLHKHPMKNENHPLFGQQLSFGEKAADLVASFGGSWSFIILFSIFLVLWMILNFYWLSNDSFDPYPFILLNLVLSCLAAFQAPIILMAEKRQNQRDRIDAKYDHAVNRKAEREIQSIQKDLASIRRHILELKRGKVK